MDFEQANSIMGRRDGYMGRIPYLAEIAEAEMAFGIDKTKLCFSCDRYVVCHMVDVDNVNCNFYKEEVSE